MSKINEKLEIIKKFQTRFPQTHVGGSIGLFLLGIDLKRDLAKSDIDLTSPVFLSFELPLNIDNAEESSNPEDFDYAFRVYPNGSSNYTKVDINVIPGTNYSIINYNGINYNVSNKEDILIWKKKYANKGVQKHIDDLVTIETGVRPPEQVFSNTDDLPF